MKTKICSKCKIEKNVDEFHNRAASKDGKHFECKMCRAKYNKQYYIDRKEPIIKAVKQYYLDHKERIAEYNKQWRLYNKEHIVEVNKQWKLDNPKYAAGYRQDNKVHLTEYNKQWIVDNPESVHNYNVKKRAKLKGWGLPLPMNNWFEGSHLHHLHIDDNHQICIYVPAELHNSIYHAWDNLESMTKINLKVFQWYINSIES